MRAVAMTAPLPIDDDRALIDIDLPEPKAAGRDLLVEVRAVSVNPVDTKVRQRPLPEGGGPRVLGWDAAGIVVATGPETRLFKPGDAVFYAGALERPGTNAQVHLVDERIVGPKPASLDFSEAAALPLTAITAYEALFDRLRVGAPVSGAATAVLVIGGAGGVSSMAIQLVRALTGLRVIATASRPASKAWVEALGAHHVLDHATPLAPQVEALGLGPPGFVFSTTETGRHLADIATLIAPQGRFALIDDPAQLDVLPFKRKSVSVHWEFMFTRSMFATPDMERQHEILKEVAGLVDAGRLRTTLGENFGAINAANLRRAHALLESGRTRGKVVLAGF